MAASHAPYPAGRRPSFRAFIGRDLAEGDARMIVDGDVDELPRVWASSDRIGAPHGSKHSNLFKLEACWNYLKATGYAAD